MGIPTNHPASPQRLARPRLLLSLLLIANLLAGCAGSAMAPAALQPQIALIGGVALPTIADPPGPSSADGVSEIQEMRAVVAARSAAQRDTALGWQRHAVLRWNAMARALVAEAGIDPLSASRVYALLSMAQENALRAALAEQRRFNRAAPRLDTPPLFAPGAAGSYPSEHAALAAASAAVLDSFFPQATVRLDALRAEHQESRLWAGVNCRSDIGAGDRLGRDLAANLVARSNPDLATIAWDDKLPTGPQYWSNTPSDPMGPMLPQWGKLQPWLLERPDQFRAPPPPAITAPEFGAAIDELRQIAKDRTPEQLRIAKFWADGRNTATPPGHWNAIASEIIVAEDLDELGAAELLTTLNMGLMDAGIAAWDTKYTYWLIRPTQFDPSIVPAVRVPHHPSYVSGHAVFSATAATILGARFPKRSAALWQMAEEAARSRVYAGIHYRFDGDAGLTMGRQVGEWAVTHMRNEETKEPNN